VAKKVNSQPALPRPTGRPVVAELADFDVRFVRTVFNEFLEHAQRLNQAVMTDGSETMTMPLKLKTYEVADLPDAADWESGTVYVSDETGGATLAFSDGTNWRRVQDRAIVS
jgi:hypothetical protein